VLLNALDAAEHGADIRTASMEAGRRRFDFLRGNEPYKYEWGAVDEPVHRLLVTRGDSS